MTEAVPAADDALPQPDWDDIRRVHQTGVPLKPVAEKYRISIQKISAYAKSQGWPPRPTTSTKKISNVQNAPQRQKSPAALLKRLTGLVEQQIAEIESRLASRKGAEDHERNARTLSNLTRTLDKLVELKRSEEEDKAARARRSNEARTRKKIGADADAIRTDLARRLTRIAAGSQTN